MTYFKKSHKHNIKKKLIYYRPEFNNIKFLIKVVIKLNNKFDKLAIETCYRNLNKKDKF